MSDEKPWAEMTPQERSAKMRASRQRKADERQAALEAARAAERDPEPAPVAEPERPWSPDEEPEPVDEPEEADALKLTDAQMNRIREEAAKLVAAELAKVNAAKLKELRKKALDDEVLAQRRAAGLTDHLDDVMDILIDVAPFANELIIDGVRYQHARWYTVDRRKYESLREIMALGWDAEERAGNPNKKFHRSVAGTMNPMMNEQRMDDGTFTVGLDTRINALTGGMSGLPSGA